jgi:hypothetical protein
MVVLVDAPLSGPIKTAPSFREIGRVMFDVPAFGTL